MCSDKSGAVLPLVLGILLAVSCLFASLLGVPGGVRRISLSFLEKQQSIYDAESALLAYLAGLPPDYFEKGVHPVRLPQVTRSREGPWADLSAKAASFGTVHVLAGIACDSVLGCLESNRARREIGSAFRDNLDREIRMRNGLEVKSGNRRFLGRLQPVSLRVESGDLSLDLDGNTSSACFWVDGSAVLRGNAVLDTLRIFAKGSIEFRGHVKVRFLEAFSEDRIEALQNFEYCGVMVSRGELSIGKDAVAHYPSLAMSLSEQFMPDRLSRDSLLIPDFVAGPLQPFLWKLK